MEFDLIGASFLQASDSANTDDDSNIASHKKRVAIVGSGISGLTAASELQGHVDVASVTVFEAKDTLGLASSGAVYIGQKTVDIWARRFGGSILAFYPDAARMSVPNTKRQVKIPQKLSR